MSAINHFVREAETVRRITAIQPETPKTKTDKLRAELKKGDRTPQQLMKLVEAESVSIVRALLKNDLQCGRVLFVDGVYRLNAEFALAEKTKIGLAIAMLRRKGYRVEKI